MYMYYLSGPPAVDPLRTNHIIQVYRLPEIRIGAQPNIFILKKFRQFKDLFSAISLASSGEKFLNFLWRNLTRFYIKKFHIISIFSRFRHWIISWNICKNKTKTLFRQRTNQCFCEIFTYSVRRLFRNNPFRNNVGHYRVFFVCYSFASSTMYFSVSDHQVIQNLFFFFINKNKK